jgi:N-acetylmuramoyl-L-alanine amidase/putative methionine-R-sulfoxide reductase with GAF domain
MATSPSKPEYGLPLESSVAVATPPPPAPGQAPTCAPGHDALQALLAFSSLHEQARQRNVRNGLAQAGMDTAERSDEFVLYEVLQMVAERALALTGADGVAIALVQEGEIICRAATGPIAPDIGARLDLDSGFSGACFRSGEMIRCDDAENDPRVNVQASRKLHARSMVAVPLRGRHSVIGLLEAFSMEAYSFNDSDVRSLSLLAELILGAMKPEEEEQLEALSPVAIHLPASAREPVVASHMAVSAETATTDSRPAREPIEPIKDEPAAAESSSTPDAGTISPTLFAGSNAEERSRLGLVVASLLVIAVLVAGGLWWALRPKAAASASVTPAQLPPPKPSGASSASPAENTALPLPTESSQSGAASTQQDVARGVLPLVTGIRYWESGDSTTVVIDLQDPVQYEVHRLSSPERIYFDLHDTVLGPGVSGKTIEVGDALLLRVRAAEPVPGIARIVLETKDVSNFSVSLEQNPYRLVAEIRSLAGDKKPKATLDFLHPNRQPEPYKLSVLGQLSQEDLQLRARVPHMRIVLDAGHGGWDLGTVGRKGLLEKDLVLDVTQRLGVLLKSRISSDVVFTRGEDVYIPLEQRAGIANEAQADLFISVHANYSDYESARGVETYYTTLSAPTNSTEIEKRENATATDPFATSALTGVALKERTEESRRLAASVERALYGTLSTTSPGIRDRGVKEAGFVVLTGTSMPAVLAEISFVSSPTDEESLQSATYRQKIAEALYKGIARYAAAPSRVKLASAAGRAGGK